jgi:hypothetical protein
VWCAEVSHARLTHIADLLESGDTLPPASAEWLRQSLRRWRAGLPIDLALQLTAVDELRERDTILRQHCFEMGDKPFEQARRIAAEARLIHGGRHSQYGWIHRADRIRRIPDSARQVYTILKL